LFGAKLINLILQNIMTPTFLLNYIIISLIKLLALLYRIGLTISK